VLRTDYTTTTLRTSRSPLVRYAPSRRCRHDADRSAANGYIAGVEMVRIGPNRRLRLVAFEIRVTRFSGWNHPWGAMRRCRWGNMVAS
jgi:hypothetical protein